MISESKPASPVGSQALTRELSRAAALETRKDLLGDDAPVVRMVGVDLPTIGIVEVSDDRHIGVTLRQSGVA